MTVLHLTPAEWNAVGTAASALIALAAVVVALRARSDSRRSAAAAEKSAQAARDLAAVERERLDVELQPQFRVDCRVNTVFLVNEGPVDYDSVTLRLLETEGGQAYVGIGDEHAQEIELSPVPIGLGRNVKITRAETGQDLVRVELVCRSGNVTRSRIFERRAHRPAQVRLPQQGRLPRVGERHRN